MFLKKRGTAVLAAGALAVALLPGTVGAAPAAALSAPTHSYADAIRQTVYVEAPVDGDRDGRKDRIVADVIRPKATDSGHRAPVIMEASPYYAPAPTAKADGDGRYRAALDSGYKDEDDDGVPTRFPGWYDNFFVPRGYAVVQVDMPGTRYSEGCASLDSPDVVLGVKAVLDWLDGRAKGYDKAGNAVEANWDNGRVGMVGKSHPGILTNLVSTLDTPNLKTTVPISAMANWYGYMRNHGQPRFGDYARWTARSDSAASKIGAQQRCAPIYDQLAAASDDQNGTYNAFWAERDYRKAGARVKASMFLVHGINDWNVTSDGALDWWQAVGAAGVPRKLWLTQEAHVDPIRGHDAEWTPTLHRWFDQWLLGTNTGIMTEPPVRIERSAGTWTTASSWPAANARQKTLRLSDDLSTSAPVQGGTVSFAERYEQRVRDMVADPGQANPNRVTFLSKPLTADLRISGVPTVTVRAKASVSGTPLSALLVDYGSDARVNTDRDAEASGVTKTNEEYCIGQGAGNDSGCTVRYVHDVVTAPAEVVTIAQIDTENRDTLQRDVPVRPDTYYTYTVRLQPDDYVFKAGHRIGLVLAGTTCTGTEVPGTNWCAQAPAPGSEPWGRTTFQIDLAGSHLTLPTT